MMQRVPLSILVVGVFKPDEHAGTWGSCPRFAEIVLRGPRHDNYECLDNKCVDNKIFNKATKKIAAGNFDDPDKECLWMRGILSRSMAKILDGPNIIDAKIWESAGFIDTINSSQLGYSDGVLCLEFSVLCMFALKLARGSVCHC